MISTLKQRDDESVDAGEEQEEEREEHEAEEAEPRHQLVLLHHLLIGVTNSKTSRTSYLCCILTVHISVFIPTFRLFTWAELIGGA